MSIKKKILTTFMVLFSTIFIVSGCTLFGADKKFQEAFISAVNKRWEDSSKYENEIKDKDITDSEKDYTYYTLANNEYSNIKDFKDKDFKDKELKTLYEKYLNALSEQIRLFQKSYKDEANFSGGDSALLNRVWSQRMEIIKELHDKYGFEFNKNEYKTSMNELKEYKETEKLFDTKLSDSEALTYKQLENYSALISTPDKNKNKKFLVTLKVVKIFVDGDKPYFAGVIDGDYSKPIFVKYSKSILDKNISEGNTLKCYITYTGLGKVKMQDDSIKEFPCSVSRKIIFQ